VYNIATGVGRSLRDLLQAMQDEVGVRAEIQPVDRLRRTVEPPVLLGDASRLRGETGWVPRRSFEESVRDTLDYWRQRVGQTVTANGGKV
jgi:GDP-4-dehydro-6-deoxy-D-mannose reductase